MYDVIPAYTAGDAGSGESADGRQPIGTVVTLVRTILSSDLSFSSLDLRFQSLSLSLSL